MSEIDVCEVPSDQIETILPLVGLLNPKLSRTTLEDRLSLMMLKGYRCVAAYDNGDMIGLAGFWVGCRFYSGPYVEADNVIVSPDYRNRGIGLQLMNWIHDEGRRCGCVVGMLDSWMTYTDAHRFYERLGYQKPGYHFIKYDLADEAQQI